jgi:hypothetical protein
MKNRFAWRQLLTDPGSTWYVIDTQAKTGEGDVPIVAVNPHGRLDNECAAKLAQDISIALNAEPGEIVYNPLRK